MNHVKTHRLLRSVPIIPSSCEWRHDMLFSTDSPPTTDVSMPEAYIWRGPMHTEIDVICAFDGKIMICKNDDQERNSHGSPPIPPPQPHKAEVFPAYNPEGRIDTTQRLGSFLSESGRSGSCLFIGLIVLPAATQLCSSFDELFRRPEKESSRKDIFRERIKYTRTTH